MRLLPVITLVIWL